MIAKSETIPNDIIKPATMSSCRGFMAGPMARDGLRSPPTRADADREAENQTRVVNGRPNNHTGRTAWLS
jgi:hypothetical protein